METLFVSFYIWGVLWASLPIFIAVQFFFSPNHTSSLWLLLATFICLGTLFTYTYEYVYIH